MMAWSSIHRSDASAMTLPDPPQRPQTSMSMLQKIWRLCYLKRRGWRLAPAASFLTLSGGKLQKIVEVAVADIQGGTNTFPRGAKPAKSPE
jgi:hypothetical protein